MITKLEKPVLVTKPLAPNKSEVFALLDEVYDSGWFTNIGKQHQLFEKEVADFLRVDNLLAFSNGTMALITALKTLNLPEGSEVITTAFTFAATTHAISWNGLKPVFADINEKTMTLDPEAIEKAITPNTSAILAVHVYGFVCDVEAIEKIAKKHNLKVIYDAAHAFSTEINGKPISKWGDATMLSFHSTKLFNTIEGGGLIFNNQNLSNKAYELRNFGIKVFDDPEEIKEGIKCKDFIKDVGINGKLNEFQAAWGRVCLQEVEAEQNRRKEIANIYKQELKNIEGILIPEMEVSVKNSMQYFPILIAEKRDDIYEKLVEANIYARKYFYPLCSDFGCYKNLDSATKENLKVSYATANKALCLPFYGELKNNEVNFICNIIKQNI